jgi:hypothetical protein
LRRHARLVPLGLIAAALLAAPGFAATSPEQELADRYAPVLAFQEQTDECGDGEPYRPISLDAVLGNPDVTLYGPEGVVKTAPTAADLYGKPEGYYLDFPGNPLEPGCDYETLGRRWNGDHKPVMYAHIGSDPGRPDELALQYWFYYVFNDWNNKHESDWEMVQLVFHAPDAAAALQTQPYEVAFSQHEGGERAAWDDEKLQKDGTHTIVYPGGGSHANYYSTAVWLGRSAQEGFGCDDTSPPSVGARPTPILVPTGVDSPNDPYAWLRFGGRWGQKEAGFNNGPTGPATKDQWFRPIDWQEHSQRDSSVQIPAIHYFGPNVTDFFCGAVTTGSNALIFFQQRPLLSLVILAALVGIVAFILTRTRWSPVLTEPLECSRTIGQILRAAFRIYRAHRRLFLGIGVISIPIGLFFTSIEALLFEELLGFARLTGEKSGGGDLFGVGVGGFGALVGAAIVVGTTASALASMADGVVPRVRDVYRAVWARFWLLLSAVLRAGLLVVVLTATVVGIPVAIERGVRWAIVPQVCMLGDPDEGPLRQSVRVTRGNWWRTFGLTSLMNLPAVTLALLFGIGVLLLIPSAPIYVVSLTSSCVFAFTYPYVGIATTLLYYDLLQNQPEEEPNLEPAPVS